MPPAILRFLARRTGTLVRIITGENIVLLEQLRLGQLDLVVGRLAAPEQMAGLNFAHLYAEPVRFVVRAGHPLLGRAPLDFSSIHDFLVLMPSEGSVIRPFVERFLIEHGVGDLRSEIETVSDSFGRAMVRQTDAVWIISEGVVASDLEEGTLVALAVDTAETRGAVGLTTRANIPFPPAVDLLSQIVRETVGQFGL
jgi:LysR family pca operon transcriptional activator